MPPHLLYIGTVAAIGMLHGMVRTITPLYAVKDAGLGPLDFALAGTLLEHGPSASRVSASWMRPSISMPSRVSRARSRYARSPGMRISSTPSCRGVALIAAISAASARR